MIANRATDRQQRHRYHSARTLARALEGWVRAEEAADSGPLVLLIDRLRSVGVLPSLPGAARRAARLVLMERERTAEVPGAMIAGSGPVLTMRRVIAMVGLDGVRRAALSLRDWPGPPNDAAATRLETTMARAQRGARIAQLLRPAGYDAEVVYMVALLQSLGRLVTSYHFAEEAAQIERLIQPSASEHDGEADQPGMSEESACLAVLGVDAEALGAAVARHWGLDGTVLNMIRRLSLGSAVRTIESDDETLRATASCANEVVDALSLQAQHTAAALRRVAQRYGRALGVTLRDLQMAARGESPHDGDRGNSDWAQHAA